VLAAGRLLDGASDVQRGILLAIPLLCNSMLLSMLRGMEEERYAGAAGSSVASGRSEQAGVGASPFSFAAPVVFLLRHLSPATGKLLLTFLLGATFAPSNYLVMSTWTMRHAKRRVMAMVSSMIDLAGYVGTIGVLQLQAISDNENKLDEVMRLLSISGLVCCAAVTALFAFESVNTTAPAAQKVKHN
jgi:hypothetical protein